jgi:hypothetical protein
MIIQCKNGEKVDTARLSPAQRHVIQKLMAWQSLADSLVFFREKVTAALAAGWNDTGPVARTRTLDLVIEALEYELNRRLKGC